MPFHRKKSRRNRLASRIIPDEELAAQTPTPLSPIDDVDDLTPHKDHFHVTATGQKVLGPGATTKNPGEKLFAHKDHFHTEETPTAQSIKVLGPGTLNEDTGMLEYGHKDHAHDAGGVKIPGSTNPDTLMTPAEETLPEETDVLMASVEEQRRQMRKHQGRGRLSTILHGKVGNVLG